MAQIINQYSFLVSSAFLLAVLGLVLFTSPQRKRAWIILLGAAAAIALSWTAIRPAPSQLGSASDAQAQIGAGTAVLLELQSPY